MAVAVAAAGLVSPACGDGRPGFCDDLARGADMSSLTRALEANDLEQARAAAEDFTDLAASAPEDIRDEMEDLADAVTDVVELLGAERSAVPGADAGGGSATAVQQDRDDLNRRLESLSTTSSRVERWAVRNCGVDLT